MRDGVHSICRHLSEQLRNLDENSLGLQEVVQRTCRFALAPGARGLVAAEWHINARDWRGTIDAHCSCL